MATKTQYNPNHDLNAKLLANGLSKTVYAFTTIETETAKLQAMGYSADGPPVEFFDQYREAWTGKQDAYHRAFFDEWHAWSAPVVDLDRANYPFFYPTAGASEPLRHLIFDFAAHGGKTIHILKGEYEGFKAMAEAAGLKVMEWSYQEINAISDHFKDASDDLFFLSQPSAIDGCVWHDFNRFVAMMPENSLVIDVTYVGAIHETSIHERFDLNSDSIRAVVFSLSKPFGAYYDRIGGVFCREENGGLFGNIWFKSLAALSIGRQLMRNHDVFDLPRRYKKLQEQMIEVANEALDADLYPCDVYILAHGSPLVGDPMHDYLTRVDTLRVCLTPGMAKLAGMTK